VFDRGSGICSSSAWLATSSPPPRDAHTLEALAVRANIRISAAHLRHHSRLLEQLIEKDSLLVVAVTERRCGSAKKPVQRRLIRQAGPIG